MFPGRRRVSEVWREGRRGGVVVLVEQKERGGGPTMAYQHNLEDYCSFICELIRRPRISGSKTTSWAMTPVQQMRDGIWRDRKMGVLESVYCLVMLGGSWRWRWRGERVGGAALVLKRRERWVGTIDEGCAIFFLISYGAINFIFMIRRGHQVSNMASTFRNQTLGR